jgi:hypothetical protein
MNDDVNRRNGGYDTLDGRDEKAEGSIRQLFRRADAMVGEQIERALRGESFMINAEALRSL